VNTSPVISACWSLVHYDVKNSGILTIRTRDLCIRKQVCYPLHHRAQRIDVNMMKTKAQISERREESLQRIIAVTALTRLHGIHVCMPKFINEIWRIKLLFNCKLPHGWSDHINRSSRGACARDPGLPTSSCITTLNADCSLETGVRSEWLYTLQESKHHA